MSLFFFPLLTQIATSCWAMHRDTVATPLSTVRMASANWRASCAPRWCRRTAAAVSYTGLTRASMWLSRWRRLWRSRRSISPRFASTRKMVGGVIGKFHIANTMRTQAYCFLEILKVHQEKNYLYKKYVLSRNILCKLMRPSESCLVTQTVLWKWNVNIFILEWPATFRPIMVQQICPSQLPSARRAFLFGLFSETTVNQTQTGVKHGGSNKD